jgi:signal transduction histidine kinase
VTPPSLWQTMGGSPRRFLLSSWPWRCLGYLASTVPLALALFVGIVTTVLFPPVLVVVGLPVGALERRRLRLVHHDPPASPHAVPPPGLGGWLRCRLREAATWRELGYTLTLACVLLVVDVVALVGCLGMTLFLAAPWFVAHDGLFRFGGLVVRDPGWAWAVAVLAGPLATVLGVYLLCALAGAQAAFARWLLAPSDAELNRQLAELGRSRGRLVDAFDVERRRIERDLHDGAQQHLVLLNLTLGLAELECAAAGGRAAELVGAAHQQARQALTAMRDLIRGIYPQVLTDLGLGAAVGELAERCQLPVDLDLALERRLPAAVESTAYLVVAEAVTNAVRHAGAGRIVVAARVEGDRLVVRVTDDGGGGADPSAGSGLRGLADRTAVLAGTLTLTSPAGGPTTVRLELPCACA